MKKRSLYVMLVLVLVVAVFVSGCTGSNAPAESPKDDGKVSATWTQDYITKVEPIMMRDPFLELLGQTAGPIPYTYEEVVKLSGHSCGAVSGAWSMTRKALEELYGEEIPERGKIRIYVPGAADEWFLGVYGEAMTYITGAAPETGFPGSEFGQDYNRRNLLIYKDEPSGTPPPQMVWIFERIDTGEKVSVRYDVTKVLPPSTQERNEVSAKMGQGTATAEEAAEWIIYWNARAEFVLNNADTLEGLFVIERID